MGWRRLHHGTNRTISRGLAAPPLHFTCSRQLRLRGAGRRSRLPLRAGRLRWRWRSGQAPGSGVANDQQRVGWRKQRDPGWRVGISLVVIPAEEIARAQFRSAGTQETYRARVWVPGLASGLARDDNPPVALHHPRVPAGSAKSESERASRGESPTTSKESVGANERDPGWRVQIPSPRPSRGEG